jgi:hypothetical protein
MKYALHWNDCIFIVDASNLWICKDLILPSDGGCDEEEKDKMSDSVTTSSQFILNITLYDCRFIS